MSEPEPRETEKCWGCKRSVEGDYVVHPVMVKENQSTPDNPFPMRVRYEAVLCEECQSKRRNI